ncbi:MAG: hydroxymethylglutaryl-CoA synthase family protein [Ilumatobacter sp.]|nr:MAG: hydroxymethylglutaryl-CoA synthase family protein [Ilumatobacter sp.]
MRGIVSWGTYLPYWRLDRSEIAPVAGQGGGRGSRTVAGFDEDAATMAVESSRRSLRSVGVAPEQLLFATASPAYADKTNATTVHAALQLDPSVAAFDLGASMRSTMGGLLLATRSTVTTVVAAADVRTGLPGSADEANGGDAAATVVIADATPEGPELLAEIVATGSVTSEFLDRWRTPGERRTKVWDDKFTEVQYRPLVATAWRRALDEASVSPDEVALVAVAAPTGRVAARLGGVLGGVQVIDSLESSVGSCGAAHPAMLLASLLEQAGSLEAGSLVALVSAADGADVLILRTTEALSRFRPAVTLSDQIASGAQVPYGRFMQWRGMLAVEPPRRPEPQRMSGSAAARSTGWKFGFVGSQDRETGHVHLPPVRVSEGGGRTDDMAPIAMSDVQGSVVTYTVDRLAYSPSPPIVFAVVDFDGGGRLPVELCDLGPDELSIGSRVEPTFRRLATVDGIANYFWKMRPVRDGAPDEPSDTREA